MNEKCCWSNLWVLNKSIHGLSSTGIKTSKVKGCLYMNWMFILAVSSPVCDALWNRKWSCYTWLQSSSTPIPRCFFGSFLKKKRWTKPANEGVPTVPWAKGECIHDWFTLISASLNQAVTRLEEFPISFILFQLILQNCFFSEVQCWCYHFWTWIL